MEKRSQWNIVICCCAICLLLVGHAVAQQASPSPSRDGQTTTSATVPRLVRFSGAVKDADGKPRTGVAGITFALYKDQEGGAPLWMEVQNVQLDGNGRYTALLGASTAEGVPVELFSANEARWLGVQAENQAEQPRVLLVSVPYALKAAEAESLGGKPASAYVLSPTAGAAGASPTKAASPAAACPTPPCDVKRPAAPPASYPCSRTLPRCRILRFSKVAGWWESAMPVRFARWTLTARSAWGAATSSCNAT